MAACEKCWSDAYLRTLNEPSKSQSEHYSDLLLERVRNPCSFEEELGQWKCYLCDGDRRKCGHVLRDGVIL